MENLIEKLRADIGQAAKCEVVIHLNKVIRQVAASDGPELEVLPGLIKDYSAILELMGIRSDLLSMTWPNLLTYLSTNKI